MNRQTPINQLEVGTQARITEIHGNMTRRLLSLGLRIGSEVSVVQRRGLEIVVANGNNRVALGGNVAGQLLTQPLK
ncbi:MAG: ferrous iron transport protein A [Gammaproteobacteria bacterium]|nr:ferrous iron transport protein A [Gammaproteobacteria bacterium]